MTYRNDVDALAARHAALANEADDLARQRDQAAALLDDARARAKLPVLANIKVASPCTEPWSGMSGDDRVRDCAKCQQSVYNLSAMTRDEAEALIVARNGRLCVRYFQRFDGTILLADCEIGRKGIRKRRVLAAGIAASLATGVSAYGVHVSQGDHVSDLAGKLEFRPAMGEVAVQGGIGAEPELAPQDPIDPPEAPAHISMKLPR